MDLSLQDVIYKMANARPEVSRFLHIVRLIGEDNADALCEKMGGRDVVIPHSAETHSPFDRLFGTELSAVVKEQFGGCTVYVPYQWGMRRAERDADIRGRRAAGCTIPELATRFRLSERRIRQIVSRADLD